MSSRSGLLRGIGTLAACGAGGGQGEVEPISGAALAWQGGRIVWAGPESELPDACAAESVRDAGGRVLEAGGGLVVPGLVDAHTHLAFAGWRAGELVERIRGKSYLEIARAGGGILSTVRATRTASEEELLERCRGFAWEMLSLGVTTVEGKSGYGLETETELRLLRVYGRLAGEMPIRVIPTFLGAHVLPPEHASDRGAYVRLLLDEMLPAVAGEGLARFCDVFVEEGAFTIEEAREILEAARELGLGLKLHADQLTDGGGARLAAEVGAVSADHLEHVSAAGIEALEGSGTVAVSLPLAALYLGQPSLPARDLIEAGVPVAVATDFNPGSAPSYHLPLAMTLACLRQRMTPAEALKGATIYAARAVGMEDEIGSLEVGKAADFALIDAPGVETWLSHFRGNACRMTVVGGEIVWERGA
ncbi:MAG: imidazolonepropionase [Gemmatimonadota bacterium]